MDDLKQLADVLEAKRLGQLQEDANSQNELLNQPEGPVVQTNQMLEALGEEDAQPSKKKRKKQPAATAAGQPPTEMKMIGMGDNMTEASTETGGKRSILAVTDTSSAKGSESKKTKQLEEHLQNLDPDMQSVAKVHATTVDTRTNKSSKCLQFLTADRFMVDETDHNKGRAIHSVAWLNS